MASILPTSIPNPARLRSYILRLPLFTRFILLIITLFWIVELQSIWNVISWGELKPSEVGLATTLTPLLERFEAEYGTLTSVALFFGPFSTLPGGLYILVEKVILRGDTPVLGASVWVFLLFGMEAIKTWRANPQFSIGPYKIPTWTSPLVVIALISILISRTSFLGHLCSVLIGYASNLILGLRRDPRPLYKLPPYLSGLLILVGVIWLFMLPLNQYSRQTYISENALLPGQVHTYFAGSEQDVFRAYRKEVESVKEGTDEIKAERLQSILRESGLKVATQDYEYRSAGNLHRGRNIYGLIHAPRGDGTEAIVLVASWKTINDQANLNGVALALTLARYFKRWSLWSKDMIFLITPDSKAGAQAWVDAYHDTHPSSVQPLPLKSGALQGAVAFEYPFDHRFESIHVVYDGVNGQLPNLDLFNTAVAISTGQMGIPANLQNMFNHNDSYGKRLETMLRGMLRQGLGHAAGLHSSFIPYHIDAITIQTIGNGWQDEMALGRTIEGLVRSLNNLLEHLHQSFFFYLLMQTNRFVSIGTYLPSAMLIAGNFTIMAIGMWLKSGYRYAATSPATAREKTKKGVKSGAPAKGDENKGSLERHLALPLGLVVGLHFLGVIPLYIFNNISYQLLSPTAYVFAAANVVFPIIIATFLTRLWKPTPQQFLLVKSFSLLLLGLFLSALATLNFSLSLILGVLCAPLSFVGYTETSSSSSTSGSPPSQPKFTVTILKSAIGLHILNALSPITVLLAASSAWRIPVERVLAEAAFGWDVWGLWTQVAVWCIWWPAWLAGCVSVSSSLLG